jgi:lysophospholipase L1-like esterase
VPKRRLLATTARRRRMLGLVANLLLLIASTAVALKGADLLLHRLARARAPLYVEPVNAQGWRARRNYTADRPPGVTRRIAVVGDSFTWGWGVAIDDTYVARLAALHAPRLEVLNFGVYGAGPREELRVLRRVLRDYRPDHVVWQVFVNDIGGLRLHGGSRDGAGPRATPWRLAIDRLHDTAERLLPDLVPALLAHGKQLLASAGTRRRSVFDDAYAYDQWGGLYPDAALVGIGARWALFERIVVEARRLAEAHGATFSMLVIPDAVEVAEQYRDELSRDLLFDVDPATARGGHLHARIAAICARRGLTCLDALAALREAEPGGRCYLRYDMHLTSRGHEVVARALDAQLGQTTTGSVAAEGDQP